MGVRGFLFFFAEINVSTFVFVVFKEIGEVFRRLRRVTAAHVLIKCAFVDSFSDFCALVYYYTHAVLTHLNVCKQTAVHHGGGGAKHLSNSFSQRG